MAELLTVPTFIFHQENEDGNYEYPIRVSYYNGSIEISQRDNSILIAPEFIKQLFREISKHQPNAEAWLKKKY